MLNIYTVSFFGHRYVNYTSKIDYNLKKILYELITQKEYVNFLIGQDGAFDIIASSAIKQAIRKYGYGNTYFTLVLPYQRAEYLEYYDKVEICADSVNVHPKSAIQVRNRNIVDRSDLVVCCIQHESGRAYKTIQYARKQGKRIINLADDL